MLVMGWRGHVRPTESQDHKVVGSRLFTSHLGIQVDHSLTQLATQLSPHWVEGAIEVQKGRVISSRSHSECKAGLFSTWGVSLVSSVYQAQAEPMEEYFREQGSFPSALEADTQGARWLGNQSG